MHLYHIYWSFILLLSFLISHIGAQDLPATTTDVQSAQDLSPTTTDVQSSDPPLSSATSDNGSPSTTPQDSSSQVASTADSSTQDLSSISSSSSAAATPTCLQPRTDSDPSEADIRSAIKTDDTINKACDPESQENDQWPWSHTYYTILDKKYFFNTSLQNLPLLSVPTTLPNNVAGDSNCIDSFNAILDSCLTNQDSLGGWIQANGVNYTSEYLLEWPILKLR